MTRKAETTTQWGQCRDAVYPGSNRETARRLIDEARVSGDIDLHYTDAEGFTMLRRGKLTELSPAISDHRGKIYRAMKAEQLIAEAKAANLRLSISRSGNLAIGPCNYPPEHWQLVQFLAKNQDAVTAKLARRAIQDLERKPAKRKRKVQPCSKKR